MKRLRDEAAQTPLMRTAQQLIDAVEPVPDSRERMLRIRRELDRPQRRFAALRGLLEPRRRFAAARRLPALALATLVVLFGASAFAAVRILVERLSPSVAPAAQLAAKGAARHPHHLAQQGVVPAAQLEPSAAPAPNGPAPSAPPAQAGTTPTTPSAALPTPSGDAPAPAGVAAPGRSESALAPSAAPEPLGSGAVSAHRTEPRVHGRTRPRAPAPAPVTATNDSVLVHRAVKALRHDGDAALAARLLLENRAQNPDGPLAEEALSLQIEAASALHDAKAREFAREYLNHYPRGRYLSVARRALGEGAGR